MARFHAVFRWLPIVAILISQTAIASDLYQESRFRPLTADRRAHRIGDVLTILIVENSSASATAGTKTDKENNAGLAFRSPTKQQSYTLGLEENFDGAGKSSRTGRLLAQISVSISAVDEVGNLWVEGKQLLEINNEKQEISLKGRVRPIDVAENNTVLSSRVADAEITYVGDGALAEAQHKGWLSRVLSFFGLI